MSRRSFGDSGGRILLPPLQTALVPRPDVHLPPLPLQGAGAPNRQSLDGSAASTPLGSPRLGSTPLGSPTAKSAAQSKSNDAAAAAAASHALLVQGIKADAAEADAKFDFDADDDAAADDNAAAAAADAAATAPTSAPADAAPAPSDGLHIQGVSTRTASAAAATAFAAAAADVAAAAAAATNADDEVNMDRAFFLQQDKARLEWLDAHGGSPGMGESTQWNAMDADSAYAGTSRGGGGGGGGGGGRGEGGGGAETPPLDERDVEEHAAQLGRAVQVESS